MFRLRSFCKVRPWAFPPALAILVALALLAPVALRAANEKQLSRVKGTVGYQTGDAAPFTPVLGRFLLPDDSLAVTRERSAAVLALPDSSLVSLGENTRVQVGAFNDTAAGPGATVTVNGGTLALRHQRPQGGAANTGSSHHRRKSRFAARSVCSRSIMGSRRSAALRAPPTAWQPSADSRSR